MIVSISHDGSTPWHRVMIDNEEVARYLTRGSALKLIDKLIAADHARADLHSEGHANLWRLMRDEKTPA